MIINGHDVFLVDTGTLDTGIKIDGKIHTVDGQTAAFYRSDDGSFRTDAFKQMALDLFPEDLFSI